MEFPPGDEHDNYSTAAFPYRYQCSRGKVSPGLPTATAVRNGSLPGSDESEVSANPWVLDLEEGSASGVNLIGGLFSNALWGYTGIGNTNDSW